MKRVGLKFARLLLCLPLGAMAAAVTTNNDFLVTTWRSEAGLPHDSITCLTQTRDGCLWAGTHMGMARFDGAKFDCYSLNNLPELGVDWVTDIFQDRDGTLWIAVETGRILEWRDGNVRIHSEGTGQNHVTGQMVQDDRGTIWLTMLHGGLRRLTAAGTEPAWPAAATNPVVFSVAQDRQGHLWAGTAAGLRWITDGGLRAPNGIEPLADRPVHTLAAGRDGTLWVIAGNELWKVREGRAQKAAEMPRGVDFVRSMLADAEGRLWIGAASGELLFLGPSGQWQLVPLETELRGAIDALFEDREGNLWCGSFGGGLRRIRPRVFKVHRLPSSGLDPYVFNVSSDAAGNVWTKLGVNGLAEIPAGQDLPVIQDTPMLNQLISDLFCDRIGTLWVGTQGGQLYRRTGGQLSLQLRIGDKATINAIFEDARSNLWVGYTGEGGLGILPHGDPALWHVVQGSPFNHVRAVAEAADGALWVGTYYHGAGRLKDGHWTCYTTRNGLPSDYVRCLYAETNGVVWMGTLRGLGRWRDGHFACISTQNGLWNDSISHLAVDGRGNFWISSFGGIFRVAEQALNDCADGRRPSVQCVGYNLHDGLPGLECPGGFQPAGAKTPDGRLWFPTEDGLVSVDADHLQENKIYPPMLIEELAVDGAPREIEPSTAIVKIAPGRHRLEFRFAAMSLTAPEKVRFQHKLENYDTDWSQPMEERKAGYDFIPPGRYNFRLRSCNNDGVWNPEEASVTVLVRPWVWQTLWFRAGLGLVLALTMAGAVWQLERRQTRQRVERLKRRHALELERARIAKDIHDDLGATLTQIALLCNRIQDCRELADIGQWNRQIEAASQRTIQALDEIVWAVNPKRDTLESLANYLSSFAQEHLELAGIRCVLDVTTMLEPLTVDAEVRHNIFLAAREALQNAVAHAGATEVQVQLKFNGAELEIRIADNGRGFDPAPARGNGLENMKKRLRDIGGHLDIESRPEMGTTVSIRVSRARLHAGSLDEGRPEN